jgi:pyrroloquinoline quinone (PQQ) biosynthesis protein C
VSDEISVFVAVGDENVLAGRMYSHRRRGVESTSFVYDDWRRVAESHGLTPRDLAEMEPAFEHAEARQARSITAPR